MRRNNTSNRKSGVLAGNLLANVRGGGKVTIEPKQTIVKDSSFACSTGDEAGTASSSTVTDAAKIRSVVIEYPG